MLNQHKNGNFVQKLEKLLKSQAFSDIITWDSSKTNIDVLDIGRMEAEIIPKYFRHQKFQSFVRQLNLYGFRKIKFQGRHRFTHPLLMNGQPLTSITSFKCLKSSKGSKQIAQSPTQLQNVLQEPQVNHILGNSMENSGQFQSLNQQRENFLHVEPIGIQRQPGNAVFVIPANYFNYFNFMQYSGGQNMMNLPILTPVMAQQRNNSGNLAY